MNKLGFSEKETENLTFGKWLDLFEAYKEVYNFESGKEKYKVYKEEKRVSLFDL